MKLLLPACSLGFLAAATAPAPAHPGHLADMAGHDHWVAGAAIGLAIALGVYGALKGRKSSESSEADNDATGEDEAAEAPA